MRGASAVGPAGAERDARERLEVRLRQLAAVFENAHEAIVLTSLDGTILEVNRRFTEVTGYSAEEAVGQTPRLLRSGRHGTAFYQAMFAHVAEHGHWHGEVWNRRKGGEVFPEWLSITQLRGPEGPSGYVALFTDLSALKDQQARLAHLAYHDALTGLPNRALFGERLRAAEEVALREGTLVAVGYLDLDGFKPINDGFGHAIGDRLLVEVSRRLERGLRTEDTVARFGGDEFVLLVVGNSRMEEVDRAFARILRSVAEPFLIEGHTLQVTASLGVTVFPDDSADPDTQLRHADRALHVAKEAGKNRVHRFDIAHDRRGRAQRESLRRLEEGVRAGELRLVYQPKVDLRSGRFAGAEALVRWDHPERGLLAPAEFLPTIEGTGVDAMVGEWVILEALGEIGRWRAAGHDYPVSVNISPFHLGQPTFAARLRELLAAAPTVPPGSLELEIVESAAFGDIDRLVATVEACTAMGVTFALDDFGTGYSSLSYLRRLPVATLKIDQSFTRDMLDDAEDLAIVEGVIGLARAFRRQVVAEGIEHEEHGAMLLRLGCAVGQGYGIARPMAAERLPGWVASWRAPASWGEGRPVSGRRRRS